MLGIATNLSSLVRSVPSFEKEVGLRWTRTCMTASDACALRRALGSSQRRSSATILGPELDRAIERLEAAHVHQTLEIVKLVTSNAIERVRARAMATFFGNSFASKSRRGKKR